MTKILLNSQEFVVKVSFFIYYLFSYRGKSFRLRKMTKFWRSDENFLRRKILPNEIFPNNVIVFTKSIVTSSKILLSVSMQRP